MRKDRSTAEQPNLSLRFLVRATRTAILAIVATGGFGATSAGAQSPVADRLAPEKRLALDRALAEVRRRFHIPGLAVGIVDAGVPVYAQGFGVRDRKTDEPVTADTLFHAASISKTLTATAILQLAERGELTIEDPLARYLPEFASSEITLEHLLTHSAGLQDWVRASRERDDEGVDRYVAALARHELAYPPGEGWEYSDADFNLLGAVIEQVTGTPFPTYMQQHVLRTAGMDESTFAWPPVPANLAWPHEGEIFVRRSAQHPWDRVFLPSSGLQTSVIDLMQWSIANLERTPALLSSAKFDALFERRIDTAWPGVAMGLGWQLEQREDEWLPRHPGGDRGFRALLTLYPEQRRAIAILSNGETTPRFQLRTVIESILVGEEPALPEAPALLSHRWIMPLVILCGIALVVAGIVARRRRNLRKVHSEAR